MILDYVSKAHVLPFEQQVSQNFTSELQWSPDFMVSVVLEGSLSIHYRNHTRSFHLHDIYFFPPFETFSVITSEEHTRILTLLIDSTYINKLCPDVIYLSMQRDHVSCDLGNEVYYRLCQDFSIIIFNNLKNELCSKMKLISAINDMIVTIFEAYGLKEDTEEKKDYAADRNIAILQYINDHYSEKITVTEIASYLGIHPQYFSSFFHKQFHTGFIEYLTAYRVNRSISDLIYENENILTIAINHGFSNHKTYAAAFRKQYGCSPTEYRKNHLNAASAEIPAALDAKAAEEHLGIFSFFRQFIQSDSQFSSYRHTLQRQQTLELDIAELSKTSYYSNQERFLSVGRAFACLRSDVQMQIRQAKVDYDFEYLRFRDIFSDDLYVYYEDENKEPIYSWQSLDNVFDFIISLGVKPFSEIGYMPNKLASRKQFSGWQYHPNVSFPKSIERWTALIRQFLTHYIERYGISEVRTWYFDFWTSPDLKVKNPYWNEDMDSFFQFYKATYDTFLEVDDKLRLGSPNFSTISGFPWYEAFFQFCYANHIFPSYVSIHIYGCELKGTPSLTESLSDINSESFSISNQNYIHEQLKVLHQIMNRCGFRSLDVIVSDWNLSFLPKDLIRDTCYMGPFIAHTYAQTLSQVKGMCYWSLSDIHEDAFPESRLFSGGPGMMDYHGLKKASYNTISLIGKLGNHILDRGGNYLFTQRGRNYQLLIFNLIKFDYMFSLIDKSAIDEKHRYHIYSNNDNLYLNLMLHLPKGTYYIKKYEVNRSYGSAYDIWGQMGFPHVLRKDMEDYIRDSSAPHLTFSLQDVEESLLIDETIPAHGVVLLEIMPK